MVASGSINDLTALDILDSDELIEKVNSASPTKYQEVALVYLSAWGQASVWRDIEGTALLLWMVS